MEITKLIAWRWPKFKQELFAILYMSAFQLWWISYRYPLASNGSYWNLVTNISMNILGIALFILIFLFADVMTEISCHHRYKKYTARRFSPWVMSIIMLHLFIFTAWYRDSYHMSNLLYIFCYLNSFIGIALLYRAMERKPIII